jgi:hypothetical protein
MKLIYTIFLLFITAVYFLPVKDIIKGSPGISMTDVAEEKEEIKNKEKSKEFISFAPYKIFIKVNNRNNPWKNIHNLPTLLHTIETPPPDNNG